MLTYNREALVSRAIENILNQTFKDFEFIIVDNGSADRSGTISEEYAVCDDRIHVIHRKRGNIGSGRNAGLDVARGQYILFIDDDDWCEPDYIEFLYSLAEINNADAAICGAADKSFSEKSLMPAEEALIELFWRKKYNVAFPAKIFEASLFAGLCFSETSKYDDIELMPRILSRANKVAYHGLPKYTFERHGDNNSAWTTDHSLLDAATLDEYLAIYHTRTKWLIEEFPDNKAIWRYFEWSFMISMVEKINRLEILGCESQCDAMVRELRENRSEFFNCKWVQEFELEWGNTYI